MSTPAKDLKKTGVKYDKGKTPFHLLPWEEIEEEAVLFGRGAEKYDEGNWLLGMKWSRIFGAIIRHLLAFWLKREDIDKETGVHHLTAVAWNAHVLRYYTKHRREFDDRR